MSLDRMPIYAWYALVTAAMILTGFPPLILGSILLELERAFGMLFFQAAEGGDSLLWQHLFWLFGHPEVYIIFLPAAGAVSTILPVMARTTLLGYGWIVAAAVSLGVLSFGLWVHHMFTTGIPHMGPAFFSAASTLVAVPTAVQVSAWLGTIRKGSPRLHLPMLWILATALQAALLFALRSPRFAARSRFVRGLSLSLAAVALVATLWALLPVVATSACL